MLPDRPTVVNLQSDIDHPTQSMADILHLAHHFGGVDKLKGKKIAMTWAYSPSYGKPLSVPQGIIGLASRFGMDVSLAHPEGYDLIPDVVELSKKQAKAIRRLLPARQLDGRGLQGRGHRLPQELGALRRHAEARTPPARRRPGGPQGPGEGSAWPTTPSSRTGSAPRRR